MFENLKVSQFIQFITQAILIFVCLFGSGYAAGIKYGNWDSRKTSMKDGGGVPKKLEN